MLILAAPAFVLKSNTFHTVVFTHKALSSSVTEQAFMSRQLPALVWHYLLVPRGVQSSSFLFPSYRQRNLRSR